jgi:Ca2+-binding EF-hand superfamily protein
MDFKEMWRTHFRVEVQAENLRQQLEENPLFNLSHAFDICDFNKKGEITPAEIRFLCQKRGFSVSEKESIFVFEKFDKSGKGVIHKNDSKRYKQNVWQKVTSRTSPNSLY